MKIKSLFWVIMGILFSLVGCGVRAEASFPVYPEWRFKWRNTFRSDYYRICGEKETSPYTYNDRVMTYDETELKLERRTTPYNYLKFNIAGLISDSRYRTGDDRGFILERINLLHERGDVAMPYRVEAGDYYAYFSFRTLQRSLKGIQIEIQPLWGTEKGRHSSLIYLAGANQPSWRHFRGNENFSHGLSYLLQGHGGRYSFNVVYNKRKLQNGTNFQRYEQTTFSIALERKLPGKMLLEAEAAYFMGDYPEVSSSGVYNRNEWGFYLQLQRDSSSSGWFYRLRADSYGEDFRPEGSSVTPNHQGCEFYLGYRFNEGFQTRGRLLYYRDYWESENPTIFRVGGFSLSGSLVLPKIARPFNINLDTFIQKNDDKKGQINDTTRSLNLNLAYPVFRNLNLRTDYGYTSINNDEHQCHFSLGSDLFGVRGKWRMSISPRIDYQKSTSSSSKSTVRAFGLGFQLSHSNHLFRGTTRYQHQDNSPGTDVESYSYNFLYEVNIHKNHSISIEFMKEHRNPQESASTDTYRISLWWTYTFGKVKKFKPAAKTPLEEKITPQYMEIPVSPSLFKYLYPGFNTEKAVKQLARAGLKNPVEQGNILVYEARLFEEIEQRQRLALIDEGGQLGQVNLIFDYMDKVQFSDFTKTFERIKEIMIRTLGAPDEFWEQGEIGQNFVKDINSGKVIRVYEWHMSHGKLRLGIPRRLDGRVRIEIQYASDFAPYTHLNWSVENLY